MALRKVRLTKDAAAWHVRVFDVGMVSTH